MEELLKQLIEGQKQITARLDGMDSRLDRMESNMATKQELAEVKTELKSSIYGVETQLLETNQIARNIEHAATELAAQVDSLAITTAKIEGNTATKENVADLLAQFRVMNDRLFRQEVETEKLKAVK